MVYSDCQWLTGVFQEDFPGCMSCTTTGLLPETGCVNGQEDEMQLLWMPKSTAEDLQSFLYLYCWANGWTAGFSSGSVGQDPVLLPFLTCPASAHVWPDLTLTTCFFIKKIGRGRKFQQQCLKIWFTDAQHLHGNPRVLSFFFFFLTCAQALQKLVEILPQSTSVFSLKNDNNNNKLT